MKSSHRARNRRLAARLAKYSLSAGAALGITQHADAAIHYSGPMNQLFGSFNLTMEGSNAEANFWAYSSIMSSSIRVASVNNSFQVHTAAGVAVLHAAGDYIGPITNTPNGWWGVFYSVTSYGGHRGQWDSDGKTGFFGFSFELESSPTTVYGWGEVQRADTGRGILLGWAYEDTGDPIAVGATSSSVVPEPASAAVFGGLALLALGAAGVGAIRKNRKA